MFNAKTKERFIKNYTRSITTSELVRRLFNRIEPFETAWNADIVTRSLNELNPVMDEILGLRKSGWGLTLSILREYSDWCISKKVKGANNNLSKVKPVGLKKVKKQTVANPLQLQNYFDTIFEPEEMNTVHNTNRVFLWMAYAGLKERDAFLIKTKDVDFDKMVIYFDENRYPIYREAVSVFRSVVNADSFNSYHPLYKTVKKWQRVEGEQLVRGLKNEGSLKSFRTTLLKHASNAEKESKTELYLSYQRIWISGMFYRMFEQERAGLPPDFIHLAMQVAKNEDVTKDALAQTAKNYLEEYERWKLAYVT